MRDGLEDDPEGRDPHRDVQQVGGEEEVVAVAQDGEDEVPQLVQEGTLRHRHPSLPDLRMFKWKKGIFIN